MNKLFQQLNPNTNPQLNNLSGIKQMMKTVQTFSNPRQAIQSMMTQNPQVKQALNLVQMCGGDPRTTFYRLAEEKGVNPEEVLNALK